tara:strand:- start:341 stop:2344 length:2004 start_codon:yes stop_codon:yes gene_type:complete
MNKHKKTLSFLITFVFLSSCGGGGGGGGDPVLNPTSSISSSFSTTYIGNSVTITWSSTNATSCSASGDWSGGKGTSGSEEVQITKEGTSTFTISCSSGGMSSNSSVSVNGENLYAYADWNAHSAVVNDIQTRHQPYNIKINLEEIWYKTLSIPETDFSTNLDTYTFDELQSGGIGYGTHLAFDDKTYVFHANWEGFFNAANGRAAAMIYDTERNLVDFKLKKIPGSTHPYALLNKDGTYQVLFPGVDEGEIKDGLPGDATSWAFNPADDSFTEIPINVGCHGSNKFDYENDGDEDVICQSWGGEFDYKPIIFKNNGLLDFEAVMVENNDVPGQMSTSAYYDDDFLYVIYTDTSGLPGSYGIPELSNVIAKYNPNDLSTVLDVVGLPLPYFENDIFKDIPVHVGWEESIGLSHDVRSHPIDYDNDGDMDIVIASLIWADGSHQYGFSILQFITNDNGLYVDETEKRLFNWNMFNPGTHSLHFHDFNNDGFVDIYAEDKGCNFYAAGGEPKIPEDYLCNGKVLVNDGTGHFVVIIETNQLNQISYLDENYPRWYPFPGFSPIIGMTKDKDLFWSYINHDYDPPDGSNGDDVVINGKVEVVTVKLNKKLSTGPNGVDPANRGEPDFNEFYYLLNNPEALEAIENGTHENGLEHYIDLGKDLGYKPNALAD